MARNDVPRRGPRETKPPWVLVAFIALVFLGVSLGGAWFIDSDDLRDHLGFASALLSLLATSLTLGVAVVAGLRWRAVLRWFRSGGFTGLGQTVEPALENVEALIIPVGSRGVEQAEWLIHHLRPEIVGLLYTRDSRQNALGLARRLESTEVTVVTDSHDIDRLEGALEDPLDAASSKVQVSRLLGQFRLLGCPAHHTFVDVTGGTKPMSFGAFQAAEEAGVSTIYLAGRHSPTGRKDEGFIVEPEKREQGEVKFISDHTV